MRLFAAITLLLPLCGQAQMNFSPWMSFLNPDNVNRMADLAMQLSTLAAQSMVKNEKDVAEFVPAKIQKLSIEMKRKQRNISTRTVEEPREVPLGADARPSQILGQVVSDATSQSRLSLLKAFAPLEQVNMPGSTRSSPTLPPPVTTAAPSLFPDFGGGLRPFGGDNALNIKPISPTQPDLFSTNIRHFPVTQNGVSTHAEKATGSIPPSDLKSVGDTVELPRPIISKPYNSLEQNPFIKLASTFLRGATRQGDSLGNEASGSTQRLGSEPLDFGTIRDYMPGARDNFGIRKGPGCLPFLSEFMQAAYGNCQQVADEKTFDAWGDELKNAILTGRIDLLKASQETCRRGAERQQCAALRRAISNCDIIESLQIGSQLQRAMKRCEEVSGLVDQNPLVILSQINSLVGGEFAQGFLNKFLSANR